MLKWTVCQQRQGGVGGGPLRTPGPGPNSSSASLSPASLKVASALTRRSCGAAIGLLTEHDGDPRAARRAARRSTRRMRELDGHDGDKENADTPETPRGREALYAPLSALALRDVSNHGTPTGLKTPESGKKRSRSQCRDITNIPAASRASLDPPRSRSSGASLVSVVTPESKRSRHRDGARRPIQPYEDQEEDAEPEAAARPAWPAQEAPVATLKFLPRQRTASSGVARIRQSRDLARRTPCRTGGRRHRRRKSAGHMVTPRFVRPAVETAGDAARRAVVVPLETTRETLDAVRTASPSASRRASPALSSARSTDSLLEMLERVAAEAEAPAASPNSAVTIDYSPCPLRTTQSLLALRRRLFDTSVLEPNLRTGRLQHTDHPEQRQPQEDQATTALPLTTPLIAAFNRWHRLRDTAHLAGAELEHPGLTRARQAEGSTMPGSGVSGVSPLACRLAWLRLQAQQRGAPDADPTLCPFPPFGHDGRYLSVDQPQPAQSFSSPQLSALLSCRRRRLPGHHEDVRRPASFRILSKDASTVKRSRCSPSSPSPRSGSSGLPGDTLSLLNHGPASSASLSSLCSLFPGYRPSSTACSSVHAASLASSLSDVPALSSSPLADASLLCRQRCVRRRRRTSLTDAADIKAVLDGENLLSTSLSTTASCPNIHAEVRDEACGAVSPPGLSSSGYSSSTTATDPLGLGRPATASSMASSIVSSTVSSQEPEVQGASTTTAMRPRRYGLTLPTGIPSPESPPDVTCIDSSAPVDPKFMCSTPLLPRAINTTKITLVNKMQQQDAISDADASHRLDRPITVEADFDSASLLVNRGSPTGCPDDTWDSHRVQKVVRTPAVKDDLPAEDDSINESEYVTPSPLALVERRGRSRKGLLFASPVNNAALDLDAGFPTSSLLTPSSGSSFASSVSSCRSRRKSTPWRRSNKDIVLPGELELNIHASEERLTVHVVRGSGLRRPGGDSCNAYVKVSLVAGATEEKTFRRTCVHRDSSQPLFDHKFSFEVHEADLDKRVLISVWHRDRPKRRSEFLGCMSFAVKHAVKKEVSGTFRLLPQAAGRAQNVPAPAPPQPPQQQALVEGPAGRGGLDATTQDPERAPLGAPAERRRAMYSSRTMESVAATTASTTATVDRSEDSTFLRHLELEPAGPDGSLPPLPTHPTATPRPPGRTPFTSTRRLQRAANGGFGFSVAWTQPPRVERVEPGLPAEQAGIRPGDYIIFVDKHNVVTVPEEEVLQLIRSCGNQLTLEVYRRHSPNGMVPQSKSTPAVSSAAKVKPSVPSSASTASALLSKVVTASAVAAPTPLTPRLQPPPPPEPRPSTACSAATAATSATSTSDMNKRRLHLPQVTFTSEVGSGVLV